MEFNEKLQELRKQKGLTQEELAELLYVSRTAVSKWESGRGYPNIDSLKRIATLFSVTVDQLLSGDQLLTIAEEDTRQKENYLRDLVFGLLDISCLLLSFLPLFAQKTDGGIQEVSLLRLTVIAPYVRVAYFAVVVLMILVGILTLAMQTCKGFFWMQIKSKLSLALNALGVVVFILSPQPNAAFFLFVFLVIKALMLIKKR